MHLYQIAIYNILCSNLDIYCVFLQLNKTIPLHYLDGELFQADITCTAGGTGNGKLMFKFNGTRILSQRGSLVTIIACM